MIRSFPSALPRICVLTRPESEPAEVVADVLDLLHAGVPWIQLRFRRGNDRERLASAVRVLEEAPAGALVTLDDRVDIARLARVPSVHVGDRDLPMAEARRILGEDVRLGVSTHSAAEAAKAGADGVADYVALGPIRSSGSKPGGPRPLGAAELARTRELGYGGPLVAIGGIEEDLLDEIFQVGADAVAVIGAVWGDGRKGARDRALRLLGRVRAAARRRSEEG